MEIGIVGSRTFKDYAYLATILEPYFIALSSENLKIISGGARGADTLAENYAENNGLECTIFKPDWDKYGKAAGFIRNQFIVDNSDIIIAFWNGESKGTRDTIDKARKVKKPIFIVYF